MTRFHCPIFRSNPNIEIQAQEHRQRFLNLMMEYERREYLRYEPYQRGPERTDQSNGFYTRSLSTRAGMLKLKVPRSRSGKFQSRIIPRYQRREALVNQTLKEIFSFRGKHSSGWPGLVHAGG